MGKCDGVPSNRSKSSESLVDTDQHYFSFKISFRVISVHLKCPFKINKWLKTDFPARGKTYYLTISLMKTEVKYQPALDKQHTTPSITLSHTEQNTLTNFT